MSEAFGRVIIVGAGLIGGSLARRLRALQPSVQIEVVDRAEVGERAVQEGVADATSEHVPGAGDALVVLATPVAVCIETLRVQRDALAAAAAVTDVCSVKRAVLEAARAAGLGARFVGSHPMAGSEGAGWDASDEALLDGARVWIVPGDAEPDLVASVESWWRALGTAPVRTTAESHDRDVALGSHLPQLVASALAAALAEAGVAHDALGPGGRGMVRLASSPAALWADILAHNSDEVEHALARFDAQLGRLRTITEGNAESFTDAMQRGRAWRGDAQ
jgi:prephenate dehydrogenase